MRHNSWQSQFGLLGNDYKLSDISYMNTQVFHIIDLFSQGINLTK